MYVLIANSYYVNLYVKYENTKNFCKYLLSILDSNNKRGYEMTLGVMLWSFLSIVSIQTWSTSDSCQTGVKNISCQVSCWGYYTDKDILELAYFM